MMSEILGGTVAIMAVRQGFSSVSYGTWAILGIIIGSTPERHAGGQTAEEGIKQCTGCACGLGSALASA
jgi:hypothetical protein